MSDSGIALVFFSDTAVTICQGNSLSGGVNLHLSTEVAVYLGNGTR